MPAERILRNLPPMIIQGTCIATATVIAIVILSQYFITITTFKKAFAMVIGTVLKKSTARCLVFNRGMLWA